MILSDKTIEKFPPKEAHTGASSRSIQPAMWTSAWAEATFGITEDTLSGASWG